MRSGICLFLFFIFFYPSLTYSANKVSAGTGNWATAATWSPSGVPAAGDNVTILTGHTVTMNGNPGSCNNLTVNGTATWGAGRTTNVGGNLVINNGGTLGGNNNGTLNVTGTMSVPAGAAATFTNITLSVSGTSTIDGTVTFTSTGGTKTFANITVSSTGTWNCTAAESFTVNGSITSSGTFTSNTGTYTISGNYSVNGGSCNFGSNTISGTLAVATGANLTIDAVTVAVTNSTTIDGTVSITNTTGTKTFGDLTISSTGTWNATVAESITINGNITNNGTFTSNTGTYTFAGTGKTISGTVSVSTASFSGTYTNNGTFSASVSLAGAGSLTQGANSTLILGGTSAITTLNATTNTPNLVKYNGTAAQTMKTINYYNLEAATSSGINCTFGGNTTVNNNFTVTSGTARTGANIITVTGATSITGALQINSATGAKTFGDITVNSAGTWNATVSVGITVNGNISNSGTFTSNTGTYTLAGSSKTISGTLSISSIAVTGSYSNNATLTCATSLSGAGTFSQGSVGTLNINTATFSVTTFNASQSGNTVSYGLSGAQNVRVPADGAYYNLTIAGSGTKTLLGATTANNNLTISAGTLSANNFNLTIGGNWSNSGTYTAGTNTTTFNGSGAQSITKSGGETFNKLTISGSGTKTLGSAITTNSDITISSTLDVSSSNYAATVKGNWTNNGTFTQQSGTVTFSGASAQTIGGSSATSFYNLTQSNSAGVSLTKDANLYSVLTISAGTFTATGFNFRLKSTTSETARIAAIPGGANYAGNIIFERYTGTGPTDWRFLCSSVSGATIADWADDFSTSGFTGSSDPTNGFISIYSYDETVAGSLNNGYVSATNTTNSISNGKGFWVYLGPNPVTYSVTGPPYTFSHSIPVSYTNSGSSTDDGWNLVVNPYPSAVDWSSASWTKTNLDDAIYIYNSSTGSFASYVGGVGVNGGTRYIASQQAFWVKANAASPAFSGVENVKASSNDPSYLKEMNSPNTSHYPMAFKDFPVPLNANTVSNSIRFTASGNGFDDETFIRFTNAATTNFDNQLDAWKLLSANPAAPNISSVINDSLNLSINALPGLNSAVTIPIRLLVPVTGNYSIRRDSTLMLPMSACVLLEDLATGSTIDLRQTISYSFSISDTTSAPRFLLHLFAPITKNSVNPVCSADSSGIAIAKGTGSGPWNYIWTNSNGDTLKQTSNSFSADSLTKLSAGIYSVEVSGSVCGTVRDTFQIKSASNLLAMLNYTDVSCYGKMDGEAHTIISGGVSPFTFLWSNGASTSAINNLSAGNYSVTVTDSLGCSQTQFAIISQPQQLISAFSASADTVNLFLSNSDSFMNSSAGATNYLWDFGDTTSTDTTKNPTHYYDHPGSYTVTLIAASGNCTDTSRKIITVIYDNATSLHEISNSSSVNIIYDNGEVFLDFNLSNETDISIAVYDMFGKKVIAQNEFQIQKKRIKLETSVLASGIYIAVSSMKEEIISKKIVIPSR